jgi:cysteine-rich repeat protein
LRTGAVRRLAVKRICDPAACRRVSTAAVAVRRITLARLPASDFHLWCLQHALGAQMTPGCGEGVPADAKSIVIGGFHMRKMFSVLAYTAAWLSLSPVETEAQIQITTLPGSPTDAEDLALTLIGSPGVVLVSGSARFTGFNGGSGFFTGGEDFLPFSEGIALTSGDATQLPGPNTGSGFANPDLFSSQTVNGTITPGDQQLSQFIGDTPTYNAAVLEFSFIPSHDVVSFRYVFGSEEYNEFVGAPFNDIFAFFLNGANIALIPGSQVQIRINSVNANSNSQFFTDNTLPGAPLNTKLDGLVGVRQALYATGPVIAGQVNTIRLAVADVFDASFDSAVVIEAGSFIDAPPPGCGDGIVQAGEECDDSNVLPGDGCSPTCTIETGACGDGTVDPSEQCDPPDGITCDNQCQSIPIACGDRIVQPGEQCDDGNTLPGDGCSPACAIEAGVCGDGSVHSPEQCDPPDGVTCDSQCQFIPIACGDGIVQPGEQCEPPNTSTCGANCQAVIEFCGDAIVQSTEECDDGNFTSGDGCSADCRIEGTACSDSPCGQNGTKVEICHVPPGNERNAHTICIGSSAVASHLANHPDHCGPCEEQDSREREQDGRAGKSSERGHKDGWEGSHEGGGHGSRSRP